MDLKCCYPSTHTHTQRVSFKWSIMGHYDDNKKCISNCLLKLYYFQFPVCSVGCNLLSDKGNCISDKELYEKKRTFLFYWIHNFEI